MLISRKIRKQRDRKIAQRRWTVWAGLTLAVGVLIYLWLSGQTFWFTTLVALLFFGVLLGDIGSVRRFLPGLNTAKTSRRILATIVYMFAALAVIGLVATKFPS